MNTSPPWLSPGTWTVRGAAVIGAEGHLVQVEAKHSGASQEPIRLTGLPEISVCQTRDRVRAAIVNSGLTWPGGVTVTVRPESLPKHGSGLDLAIAVAVLTAAGAVAAVPERCLFYGELGLDGSLRPVRGVVPAVLAAAHAGCTQAVVPEQNAAEAVTVPGMTVIPAGSLRDVVAWLRGDCLPARSAMGADLTASSPHACPEGGPDCLAVPPMVRQAAEVSAAGGHHLCLTGPPGAPIPAIAAAVAALMPPLAREDMVEVTAIHSAAGLLGPGHAVITRPPFRAPHHTITPAAMAGGGQEMRPGEAALAHRGVLFLADAPEFPRAVLGMLRQPLCDGEIIVARGGRIVRFPAAFTLIAGMAPCPCRTLTGCSCSQAEARRYRGRVSRELGHRIDMWLDLAPAAPAGDRPEPHRQAGHVSAGRVAAARDRTRHRLAGTPWRLNGDIPGAELRRSYLPPPEAMAVVHRAVDLGRISAQAAHRVLRVAWTLADLEGLDHPGQDECSQALALHLGGIR